jgi:hypothetical protein
VTTVTYIQGSISPAHKPTDRRLVGAVYESSYSNLFKHEVVTDVSSNGSSLAITRSTPGARNGTGTSAEEEADAGSYRKQLPQA